jgi:hypothetical protein
MAADTFASIKAEWTMAQARRIELAKQLAAVLPPSRPATGDGLVELTKTFAMVRAATREDKREILAVQRISYADGNVEIEYAVPREAIMSIGC